MNEHDREWCTRIHAELFKWPMTSPFRVPVDPVKDQALNYLEIVSHPMDLTTMRKKLTDSMYHSADQFVNDFRLICDNAIKFNGGTSMYGCIARDLRNWIDEHYKNKGVSAEDEWLRKLTNAIDRMKEHVHAAPEGFASIGAVALATTVVGQSEDLKT